jgi:valyl-tRNA synthetase
MGLRFGLNMLLRLFAPIVPYITEETWSWHFAEETGFKSIHLAPWPSEADFADIPVPDNPGCFDAAVACLSAIHKHKTLSNVSVGKEIADLEIVLSGEAKAELEPVAGDVMAAARAAKWTLTEKPDAEGYEVLHAEFR